MNGSVAHLFFCLPRGSFLDLLVWVYQCERFQVDILSAVWWRKETKVPKRSMLKIDHRELSSYGVILAVCFGIH